ncbi:MAG: type II toxin-antitoxin system RelE/ParE family toxin [Marvinbryantia sp.]|uniref:Plasmid stabilization system protein, RelE/ParE family n=1 Tax=Marvinbryantia formatexigens DSM 14469 TaxID=478749 RepID=C6LJ93_9FIRM|nr:type II toxin-antitoxin system RelE/ParE family toxin [Marvinbryantia formatexigens]EET59207.1 plasmid stabilization system protein, RelE/ParE family [Marvinbryantia formatexigens DSM 14469]UWO25455.1 type II toxin-antitoxin system RelE/ParE family toxin [Marvinbryantia formatexigens DSM 14469]SDG75811.1 Plasmid stabilization system protein ParE [Marvinbryantia formatexigens]
MAYRVEILPTAWEDLKRIEDWYAVQFDVETAVKVSDHILDVIERLEQFLDFGSMIPDTWLNEQGYRMVICKKHVAIYRKIDKTVYVYHIADTQTEYTKLFY